MPYIIDGHNLIPKIPGLSLEVIDDEIQLIELLQEFCRRKRKKVEVYFDNAPPGGTRTRNFGFVTARFVRQGRTADDAISDKLRILGGEAHNWTVVSSDLAVGSAARAARANYLSSETFAGILAQTMSESSPDTGDSADIAMDPDELDEWMRIFGAE